VSDDVGTSWARAEAKKDYVTMRPRTFKPEGMPDVRGMSARDAVYVLEKRGYRVTVKGAGRVVGQSPAAGNPVSEGSQIILQLSMKTAN
jgi:cell division protein FtsI (penicillin-binding protein 3)